MRHDRDDKFKARDARRRAREKSASRDRKAERAALRDAADGRADPAARVRAAFEGRDVPGGNPLDAVVRPLATRRPVERDSARELLEAVAAHSLLLDPARGGPAWAGPVVATVELRGRWRRRPRDWRARGVDPRRQFGQLLRFLFADYPLAPCWDEPFVAPADGPAVPWPDAATGRRWFADVAQGRSLRDLDGFPVEMTKRVAHALATSPPDLTLAAAVRRAQVVGSGGSERLATAVAGSRLGRQFFDPAGEAFWAEVVRFLSAAGLLDAREVGPLVDYLHHLRFAPARPGRPPERPDLSMAGRSPAALIRQMHEWHGRLNRGVYQLRRRADRAADLAARGGVHGGDGPRRLRRPGPAEAWPSCGVPGWFARRSLPDGDVLDEVAELTTADQLRAEGAAMAHCVASYAHQCASGASAVFSYRQDAVRVLTIEVAPAARRVVQVRGRRNRPPTVGELRVIGNWCRRRGLTVDRHVGAEG